MGTLQQSLDQEIEELPRHFFEGILSKKLHAQGIKVTKKLSRKLATHILSGNTEPFVYGKENATITLGDNDLEEITRALNSFCETQLPELFHYIAGPFAKSLLTTLKSNWADEQAFQQAEFSEFRKNLENRWGEPIGKLRMLLSISREWCQEVYVREMRLKTDNKTHLRDVLIRLLVRACQVTDEIICLLENGFADGAMARWRTLHEIGVVAAVISQHGEGIVERYVAHQAVESKRAMDKYMECCERLGYKAIPERERQKITKAYDAAVVRYGKNFKSDYGWAATHLKNERPTFTDLEVEAGRAEMRAHYQMANDNVHAGIKSMYVRLGLLDDYTKLLAGRSNAGLTEPGQNTAHTLTQISGLVCLSEGNVDDIAIAEMMNRLRDEIPRSFYRVEKMLRRDDKEYKKTT